jgi:hypothetical protein
LEPGTPKVSAIFEYSTMLPPVTMIDNGVGEIGAVFPLSVTVAEPYS